MQGWQSSCMDRLDSNSLWVRVHRVLVGPKSETTGRLNAGFPLAGEGAELDAIAAVIIGGASFFGGVGNVWGTLIGVLIMGVLRNGLNQLNVQSDWHPGRPVWRGTVDDQGVTVQVRPVLNGLRLDYQGVSVDVHVYTR